jgi:hypothetical protein
MPAINVLDDAVCVGGSDKGSGFAVVLAALAVDSGFEWTPPVAGGDGEQGEESLDGIRPGLECKSNVHRRRRASQARTLGWVVGGIVVESCIVHSRFY